MHGLIRNSFIGATLALGIVVMSFGVASVVSTLLAPQSMPALAVVVNVYVLQISFVCIAVVSALFLFSYFRRAPDRYLSDIGIIALSSGVFVGIFSIIGFHTYEFMLHTFVASASNTFFIFHEYRGFLFAGLFQAVYVVLIGGITLLVRRRGSTATGY